MACMRGSQHGIFRFPRLRCSLAWSFGLVLRPKSTSRRITRAPSTVRTRPALLTRPADPRHRACPIGLASRDDPSWRWPTSALGRASVGCCAQLAVAGSVAALKTHNQRPHEVDDSFPHDARDGTLRCAHSMFCGVCSAPRDDSRSLWLILLLGSSELVPRSEAMVDVWLRSAHALKSSHDS